MVLSGPAKGGGWVDEVLWNDFLYGEKFEGGAFLDLAPGMCGFMEEARRRGGVVTALSGEGAALEGLREMGREALFDGIFCYGSGRYERRPYHAADCQSFVDEVVARLKPGGWVWMVPWGDGESEMMGEERQRMMRDEVGVFRDAGFVAYELKENGLELYTLRLPVQDQLQKGAGAGQAEARSDEASEKERFAPLPAADGRHWMAVQWLLSAGVRQVLELGCGSGEFGRLMEDCVPGVSYHGVDADAGRIAEAKAADQRKDLRFSRGRPDTTDLLKKGAFEAVVWLDFPLAGEMEAKFFSRMPKTTRFVTCIGLENEADLAFVRERFDRYLTNIEVAPVPARGQKALVCLVAGIRRKRRRWRDRLGG